MTDTLYCQKYVEGCPVTSMQIIIDLIQFYLYRAFNNRYCHEVLLQKFGNKLEIWFINLLLLIKPELLVARKNSLRQQTEETLRGTKFKREPVVIRVTLDG